MTKTEQVLKPVIDKAIEIFNGEEVQAIMDDLLEEYKASQKAKHTQEEWDELKQRLLSESVMGYFLKDKKALNELGKAVYEDLREKGE